MIRVATFALVLAVSTLTLAGCKTVTTQEPAPEHHGGAAPNPDPAPTCEQQAFSLAPCKKKSKVDVRFQALFTSRTVPKVVGSYNFGLGPFKLSSTSGVIDKTEDVTPGQLVTMTVAPERTDAFGDITCRITARGGKQLIDQDGNGGHGGVTCTGTVPLK
jgi:hypothetical protein